MKKILKFPLPPHEESWIKMPYGAKILDVDHQQGRLYVWALCDPNEPETEYLFRVHGTGFELPDVYKYERYYFKTVHVHEQGLVWHVFDLNKEGV